MKKHGLTYDFSQETIASLLAELRSLARNGLPTDSPYAQEHKDEIIRRGMPLGMIERVLSFWAEAEGAGAAMTITQGADGNARILTITLPVDEPPRS